MLQTETGLVLVTFLWVYVGYQQERFDVHLLQDTPWPKLMMCVETGSSCLCCCSRLTSQGSHEATGHPSVGHLVPTVVLFMF